MGCIFRCCSVFCWAFPLLCQATSRLALPLQCPAGPFNSFAKHLTALLCRCCASPGFSMLCLCCATYGLTVPCLCASLTSFLRVAVAVRFKAPRRSSLLCHCSSAHCCALPFRLKAFLIVAIANHRPSTLCRCCARQCLDVLCRCFAPPSDSMPCLRFSQQRLYGCVNVCDVWNKSLVKRLTKDL